MSTKGKLTKTTSESTASASGTEVRDVSVLSHHGSLKTSFEEGEPGSSAKESANEESRPSEKDVSIDPELGATKDGKESEGTITFGNISKEGEGSSEEVPAGLTDDSLKPRLSQAKRQWSIQAVKGKVTTSCLWNACKALTIGTILIFIGAGMATVGYYAEEENLRRLQNLTEATGTESAIVMNQVQRNKTTYWRPPQIVGSNGPRRPRPPPAHAANTNILSYSNLSSSSGPKATLNVPSSSYGLNKLSYVGPIVMGIGGFVIVAACVMTFEARDSAAKIVPARFRKPFPERPAKAEDSGVRHSAAQTKWETLGLYETEFIRYHHEKELNRRALTSAFIKFSKNIQSSVDSTTEYYDMRGVPRSNLVKCPSAPSLIREFHHEERKTMEAPRILRVSAFPRPPPRRRLSSNAYPRQAMSVDNPAVREVYTASYPQFIGEKGDEEMELGASATGVHRVDSDASLALDLHLPKCAVTLSVRDNSRSPSGQTDHEEVSPATPLPEHILTITATEELAGPSGINSVIVPISLEPLNVIHPKVDKQTSTSDHNHLAMKGWSYDNLDSSRQKGGGSFRESKRPKAVRKVKRSETIDTASHSHKKSHNKSHRSRSGSIRSPHDVRRMTPTRSETARKHQLLRQPKVEGAEFHDE